MPTTKASAVWNGTLREGNGTMKLPSGTYEGPYTFYSRFEKGAGKDTGTNPEELIAAAHAGCFSMALSGQLANAGFPPETIESTAEVTMATGEGGSRITKSHLITRARVPGIDEQTFQEKAKAAAAGCPVSKALAGIEITVEATLEG
jgi:osmotically inducible protein OsmC